MSLGYVILVLAIYVLTIMRLTRLINADTILDKPRLYVAGKVRKYRLIHSEATALGQVERAHWSQDSTRRWSTVMYFVQCPWCVGMWLALATAFIPAWLIGWPWWTFLPVALATSHLVGVCARFADTEEIEIEDDDN